MYDARKLRGSEGGPEEEGCAVRIEVTREGDAADRGRGEGSEDHARVFAEQQRRRADADAHVVRFVLVRVNAVVHERPEHAAGIQRPGDGPVDGAGHGGPAEERTPIERKT